MKIEIKASSDTPAVVIAMMIESTKQWTTLNQSTQLRKGDDNLPYTVITLEREE